MNTALLSDFDGVERGAIFVIVVAYAVLAIRIVHLKRKDHGIDPKPPKFDKVIGGSAICALVGLAVLIARVESQS